MIGRHIADLAAYTHSLSGVKSQAMLARFSDQPVGRRSTALPRLQTLERGANTCAPPAHTPVESLRRSAVPTRGAHRTRPIAGSLRLRFTSLRQRQRALQPSPGLGFCNRTTPPELHRRRHPQASGCETHRCASPAHTPVESLRRSAVPTRGAHRTRPIAGSLRLRVTSLRQRQRALTSHLLGWASAIGLLRPSSIDAGITQASG